MPCSEEQPVLLIDTDVGVDDALALMLALSTPCKILAITCVSGNVELPYVYSNVLRLLHLCGRLEVPVYQGCQRPLVAAPMNAAIIHGQDGLGGVADRFPLPDDKAFERRSEHASQALVTLARKHAGAVTLVALGPLTNLAVAARLDPDFFSNFKQIVIMGGTCDGIGNVTASGEFNFVCDPEATRVVLTEASDKIQLVPYETCIRHSLDWTWYSSWLAIDTPKSRMVRDICGDVSRRMRDVLKLPGFYSCDLLAMATVLNPAVVLKTEMYPAWLELHGTSTRGTLIVDKRPGLKGNKPSILFVLQLDTDALKEMYTRMLR
ncbi:uncharacterized protein LOC144118538 isoform X2 [Amblyomma americanum]